MTHYSILIVLLALISPITEQKSLSVQQPSKIEKENNRQDNKANERQELNKRRQRGVQIVHEAAEDAFDVNDIYCSSRIKATIADLLWSSDKNAARIYLMDSFDHAVNYYREKNEGKLKAVQDAHLANTDLRIEIIRIATMHDKSLGQDLQDRYISEKAQEHKQRAQNGQPIDMRTSETLFGANNISQNDLLEVATAFLNGDVSKAADITQQALSKGIPSNTAGFLNQLALYDRAAADQLYLQSLGLLGRNPIAAPGQLLVLSAYPFGEGKIVITDGISSNYLFVLEPPKNFVIQPKLIQYFILVAFNILSSMAKNENSPILYSEQQIGIACFAVSILETKVAKHQPLLLPDWSRVKEGLFALQTETTRRKIEARVSYELRQAQADPGPTADENIKQKLEQAGSASSSAKGDDLRVAAAYEAAQAGDSTRALEIVSKISDVSYRDRAASWFNFEAAMQSLNKKQESDAEVYARNVKPIDQRAYLFLKLAEQAGKNADRKQDLLEDILQQTLKADEGEDKLRAIIGITNLYLDLDKERGKDVASYITKIANSTQGYHFHSTQLARTLTTKSGPVYRIAINYDGFDVCNTFAAVARINVEDAITLAHSIGFPLIRAEASIGIGREMLKNSTAQ